MLELPSTKGTVEKIIEENISENSASKYYLKWAFDRKDHVVKAGTDPGNANQVTIVPVTIPSPVRVFADAMSTSQSSFEVTSAFVRTACANFASLEDRGEEFIEECANNLPGLNADTFAKVLMSRLPRNLRERGIESIDHVVWDFVVQNSRLGAAILKLHNVGLEDTALKKRTAQDSLFSNHFLKNTECLSGRPNAVLDDIEDQLGAYMYEDEEGLGIIRAGSAAVGIRGRHKEHASASRQNSDDELWSRFYSCYPDSEANQGKGIYGNFHQVRQITGVRFKKQMKAQVINMFEWDGRIVEFLDARKTPGAGDSLEEKKHRMVCYFFEKLFDLMMGIHQNLSSNPGFECFVGKWGGGRT